VEPQVFKVPVVLGLQALAEHLELPGHPVLVAHLELPGHPVLEAQRVQQALKGQREPEQQVRRGQQVQLEFRELPGHPVLEAQRVQQAQLEFRELRGLGQLG
jgi:hypothetical protein